MSTFIAKADYGQAIRNSVLDDVTEANDEVLNTNEKRAIELATGYISERFDATAAFAATGDDRNAQLVGVIIDLALFYTHKLLNPRKIPALRKSSFTEAMEWLKDIRDGEIKPDLPEKPADEAVDLVLSGSNLRRENHI